MKQPEKNNVYKIEITDVSSDGNGVGNIDGFVVFVPGTVTGDVAEVLIVKVQKSYAYGKPLNIIEPSLHRKEAVCPVFGKCGGCSLMHIKYDFQLEIKKGIIKNALKRIGGIDKEVGEMIGAESPERYRNKMIFPVGEDASGETVAGFYRERSHDIIPLSDCFLGYEFNRTVIGAVKEYMKEVSIKAYDEKIHQGTIRRIFTRAGTVSGEIMVVISANGDRLPRKEILIEKLLKISDRITSVILNVNTKKTNLVLGDKNIVLFGKETIRDTLCHIEYEISPHSFYQINHAQTERLYGKALEYADITKDSTVMDIYCGIGTISLSAAKQAKAVLGVEIVPQAIEDAKENAVRNGIENAEFFCADAAELVPELIDKGIRPDVVILDPPRKGSDEKTLSAISLARPERIVYVSCNPATLARDLKFLIGEGYEVQKVCGVDMFPETNHVESVVMLSQLKPDDVVQVELNAEDLALTSAEAKATYEEIKTYVKKAFGFKVSSLYIAQVKQKMGLPMGKNYNVSKKGTRVPLCPPEKEEAILEALRHYKMI